MCDDFAKMPQLAEEYKKQKKKDCTQMHYSATYRI